MLGNRISLKFRQRFIITFCNAINYYRHKKSDQPILKKSTAAPKISFCWFFHRWL